MWAGRRARCGGFVRERMQLFGVISRFNCSSQPVARVEEAELGAGDPPERSLLLADHAGQHQQSQAKPSVTSALFLPHSSSGVHQQVRRKAGLISCVCSFLPEPLHENSCRRIIVRPQQVEPQPAGGRRPRQPMLMLM